MIETQELKANIINNDPLIGEIGKTIITDYPLVIEKTITQNGVYNASDDEVYGYSKVNVNVPPTNMWSDCGYTNIPDYITHIHTYTKAAYDNWNSSSTKFNNYFSTTYKDITVVPMIDTSNITTFSSAFSNCKKIVEFPLLDTSNSEGFSSTFSGCENLEYIPAFNVSKANNWASFVNNCKKLNDEALNNILIMCINTPNAYAGTKTLYYLGLRSGNYSAARIQALPKYNDFITAGWSIGY